MTSPRKQRLDKAVSLLQGRYGARILQPASAAAGKAPPPHFSTGFAPLDAATGCGGIPLGAITLLAGRTTSGKLTVAYKALAGAQHSPARRLHSVAIIDLTRTANPDYLARCGVDLACVLVARPQAGPPAVDLIFDLARSPNLRAVLIDGAADLSGERAAARYFDAALPQLRLALAALPCAVIFLDEPQPPWRRWLGWASAAGERSALAQCAALSIELKHEQWLERDGELAGYRSQAQVRKSRWARGGQSAAIEIVFNGTVRARGTW